MATLTYDEMVDLWLKQGVSRPVAEGIADNMTRESGGKSDIVGDQGTSGGLFQGSPLAPWNAPYSYLRGASSLRRR